MVDSTTGQVDQTVAADFGGYTNLDLQGFFDPDGDTLAVKCKVVGTNSGEHAQGTMVEFPTTASG